MISSGRNWPKYEVAMIKPRPGTWRSGEDQWYNYGPDPEIGVLNVGFNHFDEEWRGSFENYFSDTNVYFAYEAHIKTLEHYFL